MQDLIRRFKAQDHLAKFKPLYSVFSAINTDNLPGCHSTHHQPPTSNSSPQAQARPSAPTPQP